MFMVRSEFRMLVHYKYRTGKLISIGIGRLKKKNVPSSLQYVDSSSPPLTASFSLKNRIKRSIEQKSIYARIQSQYIHNVIRCNAANTFYCNRQMSGYSFKPRLVNVQRRRRLTTQQCHTIIFECRWSKKKKTHTHTFEPFDSIKVTTNWAATATIYMSLCGVCTPSQLFNISFSCE